MNLSSEALAQLQALSSVPVSLITDRARGKLSLNSRPHLQLLEGRLRQELNTWYSSRRLPRDTHLTAAFPKRFLCASSTSPA